MYGILITTLLCMQALLSSRHLYVIPKLCQATTFFSVISGVVEAHSMQLAYLYIYTLFNVSCSSCLSRNGIIRPLQINSLFPVHRPHLVTVSSKYSIIPYSSIISRLFLHTDRLSKAHVSVVLSSPHELHVCVIFAI